MKQANAGSMATWVLAASLVSFGAAAQGPGAAPADAAAQAAARAAAAVASATAGEHVPIDQWTLVFVTARAVPSLGDVRQIGTVFTYEGRVHAHATFSARPGVQGGTVQAEMRWFNGDRLVTSQQSRLLISRSPYYMASSTSGTTLGAGPGRVELWIDGRLRATQSLFVNER